MPYIPPFVRENFESRQFSDLIIESQGDLTYLLTRVCHMYMERNGEHFATMNEVKGALDNTKDEFYRRVMAPYEDQKRRDNGDVMPDYTRYAHDPSN